MTNAAAGAARQKSRGPDTAADFKKEPTNCANDCTSLEVLHMQNVHILEFEGYNCAIGSS